MNKKLNTALDYLEELITNHQLRHTKRVNIRDNALLAKYFPNNVTNLSVSFSRDIIKPLSESGYIICVDNR